MTKSDIDFDMTGRVCLVTGATGGIGQAVARRFHGAGATVILHYLRSVHVVESLAAELGGATRERVVALQANLARDEEVHELVNGCLRACGAADAVVHCASMGTFTPTLATKPGHWDLTLGVHVRAFWQIAGRAPELLRSGGSLVAMSSLGSSRVTPAYGAVGVAKAALESLVRYAAAELSVHGLRVNGIAGGPVAGARIEGSPVYSAVAASAAERPCGRLGEPAELADAAFLLASPLARWIQGQVIVVDGGFSLW